jgi:hypothetical protein
MTTCDIFEDIMDGDPNDGSMQKDALEERKKIECVDVLGERVLVRLLSALQGTLIVADRYSQVLKESFRVPDLPQAHVKESRRGYTFPSCCTRTRMTTY